MAAKRTLRFTMGRGGYEAQRTKSELVSVASTPKDQPTNIGRDDTQADTGEQALLRLVELLARAAAVEFIANHLDQSASTVQLLTPPSDADDAGRPAKNGAPLK